MPLFRSASWGGAHNDMEDVRATDKKKDGRPWAVWDNPKFRGIKERNVIHNGGVKGAARKQVQTRGGIILSCKALLEEAGRRFAEKGSGVPDREGEGQSKKEVHRTEAGSVKRPLRAGSE